ncbi:MAG: serine O-acetyltransferase EpsC [Phycisphaerales bacterium]
MPSSSRHPGAGPDSAPSSRPQGAAAHGVDPSRVDEAVGRLSESILADPRTHRLSTAFLPDRDEVIGILDRLGWLIFPGFFGPRNLSREGMRAHVGVVVSEIAERLFRQLDAAFRYERRIEPGASRFDQRCAECESKAAEVCATFLARIPEIRRMLSLDVQAAFDGDPAARHTDEIIFCYPGMRALTTHRLAHALYRHNVPLVPRMMSEHSHSLTGIDIHPGARIGRGFFIDHGTGVVIGETTIIGDHCRIYQGVTLGAAYFERDEQGKMKRDTKRHPTLEDHVVVFANATILGGTTVIGAGSQINGGVFLTSSVPPGHVVRGARPEQTLRNNPEMPPASFAI